MVANQLRRISKKQAKDLYRLSGVYTKTRGGINMKIVNVLVLLLIMAVLVGCGSQGSVNKENSGTPAAAPAEAETGSAGAAQTTTTSTDNAQTTTTTTSGNSAQFSQDIVNCVRGTPWTYAGTSAAGSYQVSYTIDGKTQYKGKEFCKVIGHVEGTGLPAGYNWEYYFRW